MKNARLSLLALAMLVCATNALAGTPELVPAPPTPIGSPGSWLGTNDYPAIALRFKMTGTTAFKLTVDATGKPSRCEIIGSSGFDVLDTATCQRLMANARFSPPHNQAGQPVEGSYSNRVKWVMPTGIASTVSERFASMLLSIDQAGNVTSCRFLLHLPTPPAALAEKPCGNGLTAPSPALGLEFRGNYKGPLADVEIRMADVFTPDLRGRILSPVHGYEQRGLNIYHFTVTRDGKLGECHYEEQRGSDHIATDYCGTVVDQKFDPPFSAFNKDGNANGWHIMRVLLKTGN